MSDPVVFDRIRQDIKDNDVVLFMKGTPLFPQCGFSARVVQILTHLGVPFKSANVLEDAELLVGRRKLAVPRHIVHGNVARVLTEVAPRHVDERGARLFVLLDVGLRASEVRL